MTKRELIEDKICDQAWCGNRRGWVKIDELEKLPNYFIYGDPRGDAFVKICDGNENLIIELRKYLSGDTPCDFLTKLYLIVQDGKVVNIDWGKVNLVFAPVE